MDCPCACHWHKNDGKPWHTQPCCSDPIGSKLTRKPDEVRIFPCGACGGDGGHHDFAGSWERCNLCAGEGELEFEVKPATLNDLGKDMYGGPVEGK